MTNPSAVHEAGHATVALAIGWTVAGIELPNAFEGCTDASPSHGLGDWREHALVLLGGGAAEQLFLGAGWSGSANVERELREAEEVCAHNLGVAAASTELTRLRSEAQALLQSRRGLVAALAEAAVRRRGLRSAEVLEIFEAESGGLEEESQTAGSEPPSPLFTGNRPASSAQHDAASCEPDGELSS